MSIEKMSSKIDLSKDLQDSLAKLSSLKESVADNPKLKDYEKKYTAMKKELLSGDEKKGFSNKQFNELTKQSEDKKVPSGIVADIVGDGTGELTIPNSLSVSKLGSNYGTMYKFKTYQEEGKQDSFWMYEDGYMGMVVDGKIREMKYETGKGFIERVVEDGQVKYVNVDEASFVAFIDAYEVKYNAFKGKYTGGITSIETLKIEEKTLQETYAQLHTTLTPLSEQYTTFIASLSDTKSGVKKQEMAGLDWAVLDNIGITSSDSKEGPRNTFFITEQKGDKQSTTYVASTEASILFKNEESEYKLTMSDNKLVLIDTEKKEITDNKLISNIMEDIKISYTAFSTIFTSKFPTALVKKEVVSSDKNNSTSANNGKPNFVLDEKIETKKEDPKKEDPKKEETKKVVFESEGDL